MWKTILLFVLLSPGVLLTIPPVGKKIWMSGKMSLLSVCVHALIFVLVMRLLNVREGFQNSNLLANPPPGGWSEATIAAAARLESTSKEGDALEVVLSEQRSKIKSAEADLQSAKNVLQSAKNTFESIMVKFDAARSANTSAAKEFTSLRAADLARTGGSTVFVVSYTGSLTATQNIAIAKTLGGTNITLKKNSPKMGQNTWMINKGDIPESNLIAAVKKNATTLQNFTVLSVGNSSSAVSTPTASAGSSLLTSIVDTLTGGNITA